LEISESSLQERDAQVAVLTADLAAARDELESALAQLAETKSQVAAKSERMANLEADLAAAAAQLATSEGSLQERDAQVAVVTADLAAARADLQTSTLRLEEAMASLIEKDGRISALESDLEQAIVLAQDSAAALDEVATQLKQRDEQIDVLEGDLHDTQAAVEAKSVELEQNRMKPVEEPEIMRVHEPMGFYVDPYDTATGNRLLTAIACVGGMPPGYEPHVYYRVYDQRFIDTLVRSGDYKKVGEAKFSSADWTSEEVDIEFFYTRKETLDSHPYEWREDKDWVTNEMAWFATLQAYCGDTVNQ